VIGDGTNSGDTVWAHSMITLRTVLDKQAPDQTFFQYSLAYTGEQTLQAALQYLHAPRDPNHRLQVQGPNGIPRWLSLTSTLQAQNIVDGSSIFVIARGTQPPPPTTPAQTSNPKPTDTSASRTNTYHANVVGPTDKDLSSFYVQLSDYEIIKRLGSGAFGQVSVARQKTTQVIVAVKGLTCDVTDEKNKRLFEREVEPPRFAFWGPFVIRHFFLFTAAPHLLMTQSISLRF
jgi:hypothetical protein